VHGVQTADREMFPFLIVKEFAILQWWTSSQVFFLKKLLKFSKFRTYLFFFPFQLVVLWR